MGNFEKKEIRSGGLERYYYTDVDKVLASNRKGYAEYQQGFARTSEFIAADKPQYIVIEVNNYCNMRCKMCIKSMDENANGKDNMPLELLEKFLREANEMRVPSFFLGGGTECLINPQIKTILKLVHGAGGIDNVLITNGYELTQEVSDLLVELQWEKVFVSLDAATPETYRKIRGKDLLKVEQNLHYLIDKKRKANTLFPLIRVSFVMQEESRNEKNLFINKWSHLVDMIDFQPLAHYEDMSIKHGLPEPDRSCDAPFNKLMVDCHGNVYPCCTEWSKYLLLGNIAEESLWEIWNGKKINEVRKQLSQKCMCDICKSCIYSIENKL